MTKRIEEVLGIGPTKEELSQLPEEWVMAEIEPQFGIKEHDKEMDDIIEVAMTAHKDLIDIGMNMEPKNAGELLNPAMKALDIALKASQSKIDARVKIERVNIERDKVDYETKKNVEEGEVAEDDVEKLSGKPYTATREEVLAKLRGKTEK